MPFSSYSFLFAGEYLPASHFVHDSFPKELGGHESKNFHIISDGVMKTDIAG
jgi:hypothetical protein